MIKTKRIWWGKVYLYKTKFIGISRDNFTLVYVLQNVSHYLPLNVLEFETCGVIW